MMQARSWVDEHKERDANMARIRVRHAFYPDPLWQREREDRLDTACGFIVGVALGAPAWIPIVLLIVKAFA